MALKRGVTLIEVVIYIGLVALILPVLMTFIVNTTQKQAHLTQRIHVANNVSILMQDLRDDLRHVESVDISASSLSNESSSLVVTNENSEEVTFALVGDLFEIEGTSRTINRLEYIEGGESQWLTSNDLTMTVFQVDPVRNAEAKLVGLNVAIQLEPHVIASPKEESNQIRLETVIWLNEYVEEI